MQLRPGDMAVTTTTGLLWVRADPGGMSWCGNLRPGSLALVLAVQHVSSTRALTRLGKVEEWWLVTGSGCMGWVQWGLERL